MNYTKPMALLCLLFCLCNCSTDNASPQLEQSDLIGHWDITVPSGLQFIEFISHDRVLLGDRGAVGQMDVSKHYFQKYHFDGTDLVNSLPSDSRMENISILGERMTFDFVNPISGYKLPYTAYKETKIMTNKSMTNKLNQVWITTEQNGQPIALENQKMAYFSKAGIYALADVKNMDLELFSWDWDEAAKLCYMEYQRPTMMLRESCMDFQVLTPDVVIFEVDGLLMRLQPKLDL